MREGVGEAFLRLERVLMELEDRDLGMRGCVIQRCSLIDIEGNAG